MPKQQTHIRVVREWCISLGVLTAVSMTRHDAEMKLAAYVPMLMRDFPDAAFNAGSLHAVARQCGKGFPTYPELADRLSAWWRAARPAPPALPPPAPPALPPERTAEEIAYVQDRVAECIASLRAAALYADAQAERLDTATNWPRARHLTPEQLDQLNPLPEGKKRT